MRGKCRNVRLEDLAAYVDDEIQDTRARASIAAHIESCADCASHIADMTAYRRRMTQLRQSTAPEATPANLLQKVRIELDAIDSRRRSDNRDASSGPVPKREMLRAPVWSYAVALIIAAAAALALLSIIRRPPVLPLDKLIARADDTRIERLDLNTEDSDRAASWAAEKLGAHVPALNLTLVGARIRAAHVYPALNMARFDYLAADATPLHVYISFGARAELSRIEPMPFRGAIYFAARIPLGTVVAWENDGRTFVALGRMPGSDLVRIAHEANRQCIRR